MAIDYALIAAAGGISKGIPRKLAKGRRTRGEAKVKKSVRQQCVERDGHCLIWSRAIAGWMLERCDGPSEWAHIGKHRRSLTRGMPAEKRHTTAGSAMLCKRHHDAYDAHAFDIEALDMVKGMDGAFRVIGRAA